MGVSASAEREGILREQIRSLLAEKKAKENYEKEKILKEPWRKFERDGDWNNAYRKKLLDDVKSIKCYGDLEYFKILLLGPIMAGKSSFISSIASIDKGRMAQATLVGYGKKSFTSKHHQFIPKGHVASQYRLMDTMGIEEMEDEGFNIQDVIFLIQGNISPDYEFIPGQSINPQDNPKFIMKPQSKDKAQCIVLVVDSNMLDLDAFSDVVKKKLRKLQSFITERVVPTVLVLTKVDELCAEDGIKLTDLYTSRRLQTVVTKANKIFGIPEMNIFPVQNYRKEMELNDNMDILLLLALRGILHMAYDHVEHLDDQTR